jgi:hypothetical protein
MYSLSEEDRLKIVSQASKHAEHEGGVISKEIEEMIASTLLPVKGLVRGLSEEQRLKVFENAVHEQRTKFIKENGDALGCDQKDTQ